MMIYKIAVIVLFGFAMNLASSAAVIELANIFSSGSVLQRDITVPIWGTGTPGSTITVQVKSQFVQSVVDGNGKWRVELMPEPAGGPFPLAVSSPAHASVGLTDVYFGDVWLLTGQSNMDWSVALQTSTHSGYYDPAPDAADNFDDVRFAIVTRRQNSQPLDDVAMDVSWSRWGGGALDSMSATGYYFTRALNEALDANGMSDVPLGIIKVSRGNTAIEQWTSASALASLPETLIENPGVQSSGFYNAMIKPIQDYAFKGALWYQGESNANTIDRVQQYPLLKQTLVESWRAEWGIDFPFYFVQLAPYQRFIPNPVGNIQGARWAGMRESQTASLAIPNTKMACIIDIGFQGDVHPPFKDIVGQRLARIALDDTYGLDVVSRGPTVAPGGVQVNGSTVTITFDNVGNGLQTQAVNAQPDADEIAAGYPGVSVSANTLAGFALCGADQTFYWATHAEIISPNQVRISNVANVAVPVAIRYAWQNFPRCNLFNSEGLPAEPFRSDGAEITLEIRQGANGYNGVRDTFIREDQPDNRDIGYNNKNIVVDGMLGSIPDSRRIGLLKFRDMEDQINSLVPRVSAIDRILLKVNTTNASAPVELRPMLSFWGVRSTWNTLTNTKAIPIETLYGLPDIVVGGTQVGGTFFDVTDRVLSWVNDPASNHGWALVSTGANGWIFDSSEAPALANRPTLVVYSVASSEQDIGSPGVSGTFSDNGDGTLTMEGGGSIWGTSDNFFFASEDHTGDGELVVRVDSVENTAIWAKGGVMFRETTDANSKNVLVFMRPDKKVTMQSRSAKGGSSIINSITYAVGDTINAKWLKLVRDGNLFTGYYSVDGEGWTQIGQVTIPMTVALKSGLAVTAHNNSTLATAEFGSYSRASGLSGYFTQAGDVGTPTLSGGFLHEGDKYVLDGGGNDIWSTSDNFFFASQMRNGDATVIARVDTLQNTHLWAKAGVMFRESTDANSKNVLVLMRPDKMVTMQSRSATGGGSSNLATNSAVGDTTNAKWVKLARSGNVFTGSYSTDGTNWTIISSQTISMSASVEVGLAVTSHNNSVTTTAEISNVTIE